MEFEQKSEGCELVTWISRGWEYETEGTFRKGKTDIFQESKYVIMTEAE